MCEGFPTAVYWPVKVRPPLLRSAVASAGEQLVHELGAVMDVELVVDPAAVGDGGMLADPEPLRDRLVPGSVGEQEADLGLAAAPAAGVAPAAASPSAASFFAFFFSTIFWTRVLGSPNGLRSGPNDPFSIILRMRSDRFSTQRGRVIPPFRFRLLSMLMAVGCGQWSVVSTGDDTAAGNREM